MLYQAKIEVSLKAGHSDPEGEMTGRSLRELNYPIKSVTVGKVYTVVFEASSRKDAERIVEEICRRLLANPTKDDYRFDLEEIQ